MTTLDKELEALVDPTSTLKELRSACGLTQTQLADRLGVAQSEVSRIEKRDNLHLDTLKRYVEGGLGGVLEVYVVLPNPDPNTPPAKYRLV